MPDLIVAAVVNAYHHTLLHRPSRKVDAWERPHLIEGGATARISCRYRTKTWMAKTARSMCLDLSVEDGRVILQLGFTDGKYREPLEVTGADLDCPHCFDAINEGYRSFGIMLGDTLRDT